MPISYSRTCYIASLNSSFVIYPSLLPKPCIFTLSSNFIIFSMSSSVSLELRSSSTNSKTTSVNVSTILFTSYCFSSEQQSSTSLSWNSSYHSVLRYVLSLTASEVAAMVPRATATMLTTFIVWSISCSFGKFVLIKILRFLSLIKGLIFAPSCHFPPWWCISRNLLCN